MAGVSMWPMDSRDRSIPIGIAGRPAAGRPRVFLGRRVESGGTRMNEKPGRKAGSPKMTTGTENSDKPMEPVDRSMLDQAWNTIREKLKSDLSASAYSSWI